MINRRRLMTIAAAVAATGGTGIRVGSAQLDETGLPLQNASFIREAGASTPVASPDASPASMVEPEPVTGYILGDPQAPNTLQLYADYRCPHCRMFAAEVEPKVIEDFVKPGKLKIEFLDYTVIGVSSFDDLMDDSIESVQAAEAAACAAEQGAYLAYRDWLFQGPTRTSPGDFSDTNLINAAEALGLDVEQFARSLQDGVYEQGIIDSVTTGMERGVQGTPAMILNDGEAFYMPENGYEGLRDLLESGLES